MRTGASHGPQGVGSLGVPLVSRERRGAVSSQSILHPKRVLSLSHGRIRPAGDSRGSNYNVGRKKDPSRDPPSAQLDLHWAQQGLLGSPGGDLRDGPDRKTHQLWVGLGLPSSPAGEIMKPELILDRWGGETKEPPPPPVSSEFVCGFYFIILYCNCLSEFVFYLYFFSVFFNL